MSSFSRAFLLIALGVYSARAAHIDPAAPRSSPDELKSLNERLQRVPTLAARVFASMYQNKEIEFDLIEMEGRIKESLKKKGCDPNDPAPLQAILNGVREDLLKTVPLNIGNAFAQMLFREEEPFEVSQSVPISAVDAAQAPIRYFKEQYQDDVTEARAIIIKKLPGRLASFVSPISGQETFDWKIDKSGSCGDNRFVLHLKDLKFKIKNLEAFQNQFIETIFGAKNIILMKEEFLDGDKPYVESAVAHELQHYRDFKNNKAMFRANPQSDRAIEVKVAGAQRNTEADWKAYRASTAHQAWYADWLQYTKENYPNLDPASIDGLLQRREYEIFAGDVSDRANYLFNPVETMGHLEQLRFLKKVHKMPKTEAVATLLRRESQPVTLKSGKVIDLNPLPTPFERRFFEELYDRE